MNYSSPDFCCELANFLINLKFLFFDLKPNFSKFWSVLIIFQRDVIRCNGKNLYEALSRLNPIRAMVKALLNWRITLEFFSVVSKIKRDFALIIVKFVMFFFPTVAMTEFTGAVSFVMILQSEYMKNCSNLLKLCDMTLSVGSMILFFWIAPFGGVYDEKLNYFLTTQCPAVSLACSWDRFSLFSFAFLLWRNIVGSSKRWFTFSFKYLAQEMLKIP